MQFSKVHEIIGEEIDNRHKLLHFCGLVLHHQFKIFMS